MSVADSAAYISGERLRDERTGREFDYSDRPDVVYKEIMAPDGAPTWAKDRARLWNELESMDKRKNARLAKTIEVSLPRELSRDQQIALLREFVGHEFTEKGLVSDIAIHDKGDGNPHAHIIVSYRTIGKDGFSEQYKDFNLKNKTLEVWRPNWAEHTNRYLELNDFDIRVDHRTLKEQGIDLEPTRHVGPVSRLQTRTQRIEENREIARDNGARILSDPNIALQAITHQQATFTDKDIERIARRNSDGEQQKNKVVSAIQGDPRIMHLGKDEAGQERYTTVEMYAIESAMMRHVDELTRGGHQTRQYGGEKIYNLSEQQLDALQYITERGDLKNVVGVAGAGKSTMLNAAREAWEYDGYTVQGAALSGKAAEGLQNASGIESRTIASRIMKWDRGEHLTGKDILVVDEAGMIGSRQMERVLREAKTTGAKVVLVGDSRQIQAIEAGAAFRAITDRTGYIELSEVHRQRKDWQKEATGDFSKGKVRDALERYDKHGHVQAFDTHDDAKTATVANWFGAHHYNPDKSQIMLAFTRADVSDLNDRARDLRQRYGELGKDHKLETVRGKKAFAEHDRIIFLRNNRDLDVKNGTTGTIEKIEGTTITASLDRDDPKGGPRVLTFDIKDYNHIDHGYAATIHKAQGVTVDHAYIVADKHMDAHTAYVSMSRQRESADLFYGRDEFTNQKELASTLSREHMKDMAMDYGIEPVAPAAATKQKELERVKPSSLDKPGVDRSAGSPAGETNDIPSLRPEHTTIDRTNQTRTEELTTTKHINPALETKTREARQFFTDRQKAINAGIETSFNKRAMENKAAELSKDKSFMQHIEKNDPQFHKAIEDLNKKHERTIEQERAKQKSRGDDFFER